jgi:hypothetical protein
MVRVLLPSCPKQSVTGASVSEAQRQAYMVNGVSRNSRYLRIEVPDQRLSQVNDSAVNRTSQ